MRLQKLHEIDDQRISRRLGNGTVESEICNQRLVERLAARLHELEISRHRAEVLRGPPLGREACCLNLDAHAQLEDMCDRHPRAAGELQPERT